MKKILLTGASGFLGKEIIESLHSKEGYNIKTIGRRASNDFTFDLLKNESLELDEKYDILVHAAGKAHSIPKTKEEEEEFFKVNYIGTKKILDSLKNNITKTIVFISTVAVYGKDYGEMIDESFPLLGTTPYAKSKILAEKVVVKFCEENNLNCVILRLPLISGKNPPGNLGAMMRAIDKGYYFRIGKGLAKKSIVSAKDVAMLIPTLYNKKGIYNLTDRHHPSFYEIENYIGKIYEKKIKVLPKVIFSFLAIIGDYLPFFIINSNKLNKITKSLTFSDKKAVKELSWNPKPALESIEK